MFKELFNDTTTTLFGQISLVIFAVVFTAIVVRTLLRPKKTMDRYANMPLDDDHSHHGDA
ncbi:cbb3-type cytochrome c oxidase subunit 3 [Planctomycetales bacterium ZRK34]|nr:cbb3-type cytochrome c oxidase subunit 3 [Planctomycetales bacterium ZRK34]